MTTPTVKEILSELTTKELMQMVEELQGEFILEDALIRKISTQVYLTGAKKEFISALQMNMLAPEIAYELVKRIKNNTLNF